MSKESAIQGLIRAVREYLSDDTPNMDSLQEALSRVDTFNENSGAWVKILMEKWQSFEGLDEGYVAMAYDIAYVKASKLGEVTKNYCILKTYKNFEELKANLVRRSVDVL